MAVVVVVVMVKRRRKRVGWRVEEADEVWRFIRRS